MRLEGDTLVLRQTGPWFERAAKGYKPNTFITANPQWNAVFKTQRRDIRRVRVYNEAGLEFESPITDLSFIGALGGGFFWVVSWSARETTPVRQGARREQALEGDDDGIIGQGDPSA